MGLRVKILLVDETRSQIDHTVSGRCVWMTHRLHTAFVKVFAIKSKTVHLLPRLSDSRAAPWARSTNNVKKPHSQMCESCRKA